MVSGALGRSVRVLLAAVVASVSAAVGLAGVVGAQAVDDPDALAAALRIDGYVVAAGSSADPGEAERALSGEEGWYSVLVPELDTSPTVLADDLREMLQPATVVVVADIVGDPSATVDVGIVSDLLDDEEIDGLFVAAAASVGDDPTPVDVAAALLEAGRGATAASGGAPPSEATDGGGASPVVTVVVAVVAVAIVVGFVVVRRRQRARDARDVDNARAEISAQLDVVANEIIDNADRVRMSGSVDALEAYREASATYSEVSEEIGATTDLIELGRLNDRIDRARWRIEVAEALAEGREPPPEPDEGRPAACFFDPTHRAATATAVVAEGAAERTVRVCASCRERLDAGESPEPRLVDVGSRRVPAARAPRSHGGLGLGGLDVFDVIGGVGAGTRIPHRWGGPSRRARRRGTAGPAGVGRRRMGGGSAGRGRRRL